MDPLLLEPNSPGYEYAVERNKKPYGVVPAFKAGLTPEAEMYNGRMAMFGLIMVIGDALITHRTILDVVNDWVGSGFPHLFVEDIESNLFSYVHPGIISTK